MARGDAPAPEESAEAQIGRLEAQGNLEQAALVAAKAGMHLRASTLLERACQLEDAAEQALLAGDAARALVLAALAGDDWRVGQCADLLAEEPNRARATADALRARGCWIAAAGLLDRIGDARAAAEAYAAAGEARAAAERFERVGDAREAARVLEAARRARPHDPQVMLALAALLMRHRKDEAAVRVLQQVEPNSEAWPDALRLLAQCFRTLGLADPLRQLQQEAEQRGIALASAGVAQEDEPAWGEGLRVAYGRYEIQELVARTQSARVFRATDRLTVRPVAVKQLLAADVLGSGRDALDRLVREARALDQLRHPHVVPLVELLPEVAVIVTEWMGGGSLSDLLERDTLAPSRAIEIASAVLGVLAEAHRIGILHRDIKPSNILFDDAGAARLSDFGVAHVSEASATATAGVFGTMAYMSPEQRLGQPATGQSDIYGVGVTLLEMLTGATPDLSGQPLRWPSETHPDLGVEHDRTVLRLIHVDPSARPADAIEARQLLHGLWWSSRVVAGASSRQRPTADAQHDPPRLELSTPPVATDRWLGRRVLIVPLNETTLSVARAYASCACEVLSAVLRVDPDAGSVWFEVPEGTRLRAGEAVLSEAQMRELRQGVAALHRLGVTHGAIAPDRIVLRAGWAVLVFDPDGACSVSPEEDRHALDRLPVAFTTAGDGMG